MSAIQKVPEDRLLKQLAAFACGVSTTLDAQVVRGAKVALMDTVAVSLGALRHPAAIAGRRYARLMQVSKGATIWGSGLSVPAETAALINGVPLRGYDYNDLYSNQGGGHPSDMIPGLFALAEWRGLSGQKLLGAIAVGYEVLLHLFDHLNNNAAGWDYPTTVAVAATCASARLLALNEAQTREALAIAVISHFASDEVESSELNARGDLTMWKRFNGSHAIRQAVYATLLAECGVEGAVRPFEGHSGFLVKYGTSPDKVEALYALLDARRPLKRVNDVVFKRWPVGSRGQSAIQAALEARASIKDIAGIKSIRIFSDDTAHDHLVRRREDPWHPDSRETADHSLPYIVASTVLDGYLRAESFALERVLDPQRQKFLVDKVTAEVDPGLTGGAKTGFMSRVEIVDADGKTHAGAAKAPPGHPLQPFTDSEFQQKLAENVEPIFGTQRTARITQSLWAIDKLDNVRELAQLLVLDDATPIDQE